MGVLLIFPVLVVCWCVPAFLIFRSGKLSGWAKARWVMGSLLSPLIPLLFVVAGIAIAVHMGGYQRDLKATMFGLEAMAMAIANFAALVLPWAVYFVFKKRAALKS